MCAPRISREREREMRHTHTYKNKKRPSVLLESLSLSHNERAAAAGHTMVWFRKSVSGYHLSPTTTTRREPIYKKSVYISISLAPFFSTEASLHALFPHSWRRREGDNGNLSTAYLTRKRQYIYTTYRYDSSLQWAFLVSSSISGGRVLCTHTHTARITKFSALLGRIEALGFFFLGPREYIDPPRALRRQRPHCFRRIYSGAFVYI